MTLHNSASEGYTLANVERLWKTGKILAAKRETRVYPILSDVIKNAKSGKCCVNELRIFLFKCDDHYYYDSLSNE